MNTRETHVTFAFRCVVNEYSGSAVVVRLAGWKMNVNVSRGSSPHFGRDHARATPGMKRSHASLSLPSIAQSLTCYLTQTSATLEHEPDTHTISMLKSHGGAVPLYYLSGYKRLRSLTPDPDERLRTLQDAVRLTPELLLCGPHDSWVKHQQTLEMQEEEPGSSVVGTYEAVVLPAGAGAPPRVLPLPMRNDYLRVITEALGSTGPLAHHCEYQGKEPKQPVLYFLLRASSSSSSLSARDGAIASSLAAEAAAAPSLVPNVLATRLAGFPITGDALLADAKVLGDGSARFKPTSLASIEALIAKRMGLMGFLMAKLQRPLLGAWQLPPRRQAFPSTEPPAKLLEEWVSSSSAKGVQIRQLEEWVSSSSAMGVQIRQGDGRHKAMVTVLAQPERVTAGGQPAPHTKFVGTATTDAPCGLSELPETARWVPANDDRAIMGAAGSGGARDDAIEEGRVLRRLEVRGEPKPTKKEAEAAAVLRLMQLLVDGAPPPDPPFRILRQQNDEAMNDDDAIEVLPAGSRMAVSYELVDAADPTVVLEALSLGDAPQANTPRNAPINSPLILGCQVLQPLVETALAEMGAAWFVGVKSHLGPLPWTVTRTLRVTAAHYGAHRQAVLTLTVHKAERPREEAMYEMGGSGERSDGAQHGASLGERRVAKLLVLVEEQHPRSVCDVGCGEGRFLESLVRRQLEGGLPGLTRLIGTDVDERLLRRARAKLKRVLDTARAAEGVASSGSASDDAAAAEAAAEAAATLAVGWKACSLEELPTDCGMTGCGMADVITLIEVVEHLDPPVLAALGTALLGRCQPRALLVSTPNKEFNLNMMVQCTMSTPCPRNDPHLTYDDVRRLQLAERFCKPCALFVSGSPPSIDAYPLRCDDHRFEWTRAEFTFWARALAAANGYSVSFDGVGGGPLDEAQRTGERFHGPGPSTQIAIFVRDRIER